MNLKILKTLAVKFAKNRLFWFAKTFGETSPKKTKTGVKANALTIAIKVSSKSGNSRFIRKLNSMIIEMLTKLFEIRIVANNNLGRSKRSKTCASLSSSLSFSCSSWEGEIEKNATSDPEIIAEKTNNTKIKSTIGKM